MADLEVVCRVLPLRFQEASRNISKVVPCPSFIVKIRVFQVISKLLQWFCKILYIFKKNLLNALVYLNYFLRIRH